MPAVMDVIKERGHLMLTLIFLVYMLFFSGRTILYSALLTILVTILVSMLRKNSRMGLRDILDALEEGVRSTLGVAVACASVGVIVGVVTISGFGVTLASAIVQLSGGVLFWTLVLTMLACLVLGIGLPSIPAYIITATMAAPALTNSGWNRWWPTCSVSTSVSSPTSPHRLRWRHSPPPASAAQNRCRLVCPPSGSPRQGSWCPTCSSITRTCCCAEVGLVDGIIVVASALVTVLVISAALEGHFMEPISWYFRILLAGAGILVYTSNITLAAAGVVIILAILAVQLGRARKKRATSPTRPSDGAQGRRDHAAASSALLSRANCRPSAQEPTSCSSEKGTPRGGPPDWTQTRSCPRGSLL